MSPTESILRAIVPNAQSTSPVHVRSGRDVVRLCKPIELKGEHFLLLLLDSSLRLLDAWKLKRKTGGVQGFPTGMALRLAVQAGAEAIIVVQSRDDGDLTPRRDDLQLTRHLKEYFEETNVEVLDHLLLFGDSFRTVGGLSVRSKVSAKDSSLMRKILG